MTKFAFNERVRDLSKREAALLTKLEAAERNQDELIGAIARVQDLMDQGLHLELDDEEGILMEGPAHILSDADARMLARHRTVLAKVFATGAQKPLQVDQALGEAMALIDSLRRDRGVSFRRTEKGAFGYEPEGAVTPEVYKKFAGMHDAILGELDRREHARLLAEGHAKLAEQKRQLEAEAQERRKLQRAHAAERENRARLEASAAALFESARAGKPLPDVDARYPLLQNARQLILGYRRKWKAETERADNAERGRQALEKTVATLWEGIHRLVSGLGWIAGWAVSKRPEFKDGLNEEYEAVIAKLPEEVRSQIKLKTVPGLRSVNKAPIMSHRGASQSETPHTGPGPTVSNKAWTLPKEPTTGPRPGKEASDEQLRRGVMASIVRRRKDQPER